MEDKNFSKVGFLAWFKKPKVFISIITAVLILAGAAYFLVKNGYISADTAATTYMLSGNVVDAKAAGIMGATIDNASPQYGWNSKTKKCNTTPFAKDKVTVLHTTTPVSNVNAGGFQFTDLKPGCYTFSVTYKIATMANLAGTLYTKKVFVKVAPVAKQSKDLSASSSDKSVKINYVVYKNANAVTPPIVVVPPTPPTGHYLSAYLLNANNIPIANATVTNVAVQRNKLLVGKSACDVAQQSVVTAASAKTDVNGAFILTGLQDGCYTLKVTVACPANQICLGESDGTDMSFLSGTKANFDTRTQSDTIGVVLLPGNSSATITGSSARGNKVRGTSGSGTPPVAPAPMLKTILQGKVTRYDDDGKEMGPAAGGVLYGSSLEVPESQPFVIVGNDGTFSERTYVDEESSIVAFAKVDGCSDSDKQTIKLIPGKTIIANFSVSCGSMSGISGSVYKISTDGSNRQPASGGQILVLAPNGIDFVNMTSVGSDGTFGAPVGSGTLILKAKVPGCTDSKTQRVVTVSGAPSYLEFDVVCKGMPPASPNPTP